MEKWSNSVRFIKDTAFYKELIQSKMAKIAEEKSKVVQELENSKIDARFWLNRKKQASRVANELTLRQERLNELHLAISRMNESPEMIFEEVSNLKTINYRLENEQEKIMAKKKILQERIRKLKSAIDDFEVDKEINENFKAILGKTDSKTVQKLSQDSRKVEQALLEIELNKILSELQQLTIRDPNFYDTTAQTEIDSILSILSSEVEAKLKKLDLIADLSEMYSRIYNIDIPMTKLDMKLCRKLNVHSEQLKKVDSLVNKEIILLATKTAELRGLIKTLDIQSLEQKILERKIALDDCRSATDSRLCALSGDIRDKKLEFDLVVDELERYSDFVKMFDSEKKLIDLKEANRKIEEEIKEDTEKLGCIDFSRKRALEMVEKINIKLSQF